MLVRELQQRLRAAGWTCRRGKGSHEVWYSPTGGRPIVITRNHRSHAVAAYVLRQVGEQSTGEG